METPRGLTHGTVGRRPSEGLRSDSAPLRAGVAVSIVAGWHRYGADAVLVEFIDAADRWSVTCPPASEIVVGAQTVLLRFDSRRYTHDQVFASIETGARSAPVEQEHRVPVIYDGPDLPVVADQCGLSITELIQRHSSMVYRAEFCGFSPGFAYLSGLDQALHRPRRSTPRPRVPRGAVAIAGPYCAIYPTESPGGWHLLGTTEVPMFDVHHPQPAVIRPGDLVRFEVIS